MPTTYTVSQTPHTIHIHPHNQQSGVLFIGYFFAWFGHFVVERNRVRLVYVFAFCIHTYTCIRQTHACRMDVCSCTHTHASATTPTMPYTQHNTPTPLSIHKPHQPATFTYAVYSLIGDFQMWWDTAKELWQLFAVGGGVAALA